MRRLIIGDDERASIREVIAHAKAFPVSMDMTKQGSLDHVNVLKLKDRVPGIARPPSAHVVFPGGFRAAFSIEVQPAGLCTHLSVSVEGRSKKGAMPHPAAVEMIAGEFGVPFPADRMWIEEFEPGEFAINLLSLYAPAQEGHA